LPLNCALETPHTASKVARLTSTCKNFSDILTELRFTAARARALSLEWS
jgi:hypothetical protein